MKTAIAALITLCASAAVAQPPDRDTRIILSWGMKLHRLGKVDTWHFDQDRHVSTMTLFPGLDHWRAREVADDICAGVDKYRTRLDHPWTIKIVSGLYEQDPRAVCHVPGGR